MVSSVYRENLNLMDKMMIHMAESVHYDRGAFDT